MKRLAFVLAALLALPADAGWQKVSSGWVKLSDGGAGFSTPATCTTAGQVPVFLGSPLALGCDAGLTYDAGSDTLTTSRVLVGDGSAAAPSVAWASAPTSGLYNIGGGFGISFAGSASHLFNYANIGDISLVTAARLYWTGGAATAAIDTALTHPAAATIQVGNFPNASPVANTLIVGESGSGTNIAGANGVIQSGAGTGSGAGSSLTFKTPEQAGSGTGAQTQGTRFAINQYYSTFSNTPIPVAPDTKSLGLVGAEWQNVYLSRATLGSKSKALTDGSATAFATIALADGGETGGKLIYRVVATDGGTARQVVSGSLNYAAVHVGATYAVDYDEVQQSTAVSSGTLTGAVTAAAASDLLTFSANFDTSLGTPVLTIFYRFDSTNAADSITPL